MRAYRAMLALLLALAICCGCSRVTAPARRQRVVTRITVIGQSKNMEVARVYSEDAVLRQLLYRFSHIGRRTPMARNCAPSDAFRIRITLHYSDESSEDLICVGTAHLWDAAHGWQNISPGALQGLFQYLLVTPGDVDPNASALPQLVSGDPQFHGCAMDKRLYRRLQQQDKDAETHLLRNEKL